MKKIRIHSVFCIYNDAAISYHTVQNGESIWLQNDSLSMFHVKQLIYADIPKEYGMFDDRQSLCFMQRNCAKSSGWSVAFRVFLGHRDDNL